VNPDLASNYLELLKKALCYALYRETHVRFRFPWSRRGLIKKGLAGVAGGLAFPLARAIGAELFQKARYTAADVEEGRIGVPSQAHSMIGVKRMSNLQDCVETVLREGVEGDLIETGVWRGGACIFMRGILKAYGVTSRQVFVADSFAGLPKPDAEKYPEDEGDDHYLRHNELAISLEQVQENFRKYGLLDDQVTFLKGWFKDTLPTLGDRRFAVIRLDGDLYESTMDALTNLYPRLRPGGFCIIDDFNLKNCRAAVRDYRAQNGIDEPVQEIDEAGVFWRKAL
jgi:O-methyltransferase